MAFVNERKDEWNWHTIDRVRDVTLSRVSGPSIDGPRYDCEIIIKGKTVKFVGSCSDKIHGTPKIGEKFLHDIRWFIYELYTPNGPEDRKFVMQLIEEALKVRGWNSMRADETNSVTVEFADNV